MVEITKILLYEVKDMENIPVGKNDDNSNHTHKRRSTRRFALKVKAVRRNKIEGNIASPNEKPLVIPNPKTKRKRKSRKNQRNGD